MQLHRTLSNPATYPHVCKWALRQEWRQSLLDSHPAGAARDKALDAFDQDIDAIEARLARQLQLLDDPNTMQRLRDRFCEFGVMG